VSERTLRRQLARSDTTFRQILDEVRRENVQKLLDQHGHTIAEIAFASGYSDVSAFDHAFQRWFGRSPRAYRAERRSVS
jgi:AraC-like DNA-binding protein